MAQGHQLDEADLVGIFKGQTGEVQDLVVVEPLDGHDVDLDRRKTGFPDLSDPPKNGPDVPTPRDPGILFRVEGIEADVDPPDPRREEVFGTAVEKDAVRRQADVLQFRDRLQRGDELRDAPADQRLTAGDPDLGDSQPRCNPDDPVDLLIAEDVVVTDSGKPLLGHAVGAPEVAPVCHGNTQIVYITFVLI